MKNANVTIGNRTRDLLDCSAVPQLNAPLRAPPPYTMVELLNLEKEFRENFAWKSGY
jgi:hypothetical protein